VWTLPEKGLVLNKAYVIRWKGRVGRSMESGDELRVTVSVLGAYSETLTVVVE